MADRAKADWNVRTCSQQITKKCGGCTEVKLERIRKYTAKAKKETK